MRFSPKGGSATLVTLAAQLSLAFLLALSPVVTAVPGLAATPQATPAGSYVGTSPAQTQVGQLASPCPALQPDSSTAVSVEGPNATLGGSVLPAVQKGLAQKTGHLGTAAILHLEFVFSIKYAAIFAACVASLSNPASPNYRHFLSKQQLAPFMPSQAEVSAVEGYLNSHGFSTTAGPSPLVIRFSGTAGQVESTFGVNLGLYSQGSEVFYSSDSDPVLPAGLASIAAGILGLNNLTLVKPMESPCGTGSSPECPQGLQVGYGADSLFSGGTNGTGATVAVVDFPGDPNPRNSINTFDAQYGLPAANLTVLYLDGIPFFYDPSWASETAMDIEAVHVMAPGANIILLYDQFDLFNAVDFAAANHIAQVASMSWGTYYPDYSYSVSQLNAYDARLLVDASQGLTMLFASGDGGSRPGGMPGVIFPATDPNVLSVGGTNLVLAGCNGVNCTGYGNETGASISGGGYSRRFAEPSWQSSVLGAEPGRIVPDVSMLGYRPGMWVYSSDSNKCGTAYPSGAGWFGCSGTSLSTPLWAGFLADVVQLNGGHSMGNIAPTLYYLGSTPVFGTLFHDVTSGSNGLYSAAPGWDAVTGWGSPVAGQLAGAILFPPVSVSVSPASPTIDPGQSLNLAVSVHHGTSPYSYQWFNDSACAPEDAILGETSTTYSAAPASTSTFSVRVNDSSGRPSGSACASSTVTVTSALSVIVSPAPATIDEGWGVNLTAAPSGGVPSYGFQWYSGPGCASGNEIAGALSEVYFAAPSANSSFSVQVSDSSIGSPPASACGSASVVVGPALVAPAISTSQSSVTFGFGTTLSTTAPLSGGTSPYSCQWLQKYPGSPGYIPLSVRFACDLASLPTAFAGPLQVSGTWQFELQVTDITGAHVASSPVSVAVAGLVVSCTPTSAPVGTRFSCTGSGAGLGGPLSGTLRWTTGGLGRLSSTSCRLSAGSCGVTFSSTSALGWVNVQATYAGTPNYHGAFSVDVVKAASTVTVMCSSNSLFARPSTIVRCTALVIGYRPAGSISWTTNSSVSTPSCTLVSGRCSVLFTGLGPGTISVIALYGGNPNNLPASGTGTKTLQRAVTRLLTACTPFMAMTYGLCVAEVKGFGYSIDDEVVAWTQVSGPSINLTSSTCTLSTYFTVEACFVYFQAGSPGSVTLRASYGGDSNNTASSRSWTVSVPRARTTVYPWCYIPSGPGPINCQAGVSSYGSGPLTGVVNWVKAGGSALVSVHAIMDYPIPGVSSANITVTRSGALTLRVSYAGDANNLPSSSLLPIPAGKIVSVGTGPDGVAFNTANGRAYVAQCYDNMVSVLNGTTNAITAVISVGDCPSSIAVDSVRNLVYVADLYDDNVTIINGATNRVVANISVFGTPTDIAVNPITGKVYILDADFNSVHVLDETTRNFVANISVGVMPSGVDVNSNTNKVYVANFGDGTVSVINGTTDDVTSTLAVGYTASDVAVNPVTNRVYVARAFDAAITVLNGRTDAFMRNITVGDEPSVVSVDPFTNKVYIGDFVDNAVYVVSGASNKLTQTIALWGFPADMAVNPRTHGLYVADGSNGFLYIT